MIAIQLIWSLIDHEYEWLHFESLDSYQNFFTNRVVNLWNSLPSHIVNSESVNMFKNKIDRHLSRHMYDTKLSILDLKP